MSTTVHYDAHGVTLYHGDCLDILATLPDASVDAVVTDPPYGLEFMGKEWDRFKENGSWTSRDGKESRGKGRDPFVSAQVEKYAAGVPFQQWCQQWAAECLRVLKPGGHLLAFGGTRTWHRLACAIEDAGFEVRDSIAWMYGSGFPKSLDVSKAIDKAAGATREDVYEDRVPVTSNTVLGKGLGVGIVERRPATPDAARWAGWGTALKPAHEPIVVARKPLAGTVAANVLAHGTGALNVDGCRIGTTGATTKKDQRDGTTATVVAYGNGLNGGGPTPIDAGRWPANVVLDESQAAALDAQSGERPSGIAVTRNGGGRKIFGGLAGNENDGNAVPDGGYTDSGGASRFFYIAKADADERPRVAGAAHPTVKPIALMRWLVRLVTPPGGVVLEPFAGSGTTVEACLLEGFRCIAVEREADYLPLIVARITRQRDPVAHVRLVGDAELTLFDEEPA